MAQNRNCTKQSFSDGMLEAVKYAKPVVVAGIASDLVL